MADLSEHDKLSLLGPDYKEKEKQALLRSGVTDATRDARDKEARLGSLAYGAAGVGVVCVLLVAGNLYGGSATGSNPTLLWGAIIVAAVSAVTAFYANNRKNALVATGKSGR
ncbi:MAG: hypothetical protein K2Y29_00935 [Beijerinckiaceae bacterium]|nr:hypothetical protein [Beijerinckiaceae bacterium]